MIRVCHVLGPEFDAAQHATLQVLQSRLSATTYRQDVLSNGVNPWWLTSWPDAAVQQVPHRAGVLQWLAPPAALRAIRAGDGATILHAWGLSALRLCRRVPNTPVVCWLQALVPDRGAIKRLAVLATPQSAFVVTSQSSRRLLVRYGIRPEQIAVVRAPIDFRQINIARQSQPRTALEQAVTDGPMVLLSGPASRAGGQHGAMWAAAIVQQVHRGLRIVAPFDSRETQRLRRFMRSSHCEHLMMSVPDHWSWPDLVCAADVMLDGAAEHSLTEPLAWAMAAGLPIVATAIRSSTELLADRHNGWLARDNTPFTLASTLLRALDDMPRSRLLAETGRGQAYEIFGLRDFADNMDRLYGNLLSGTAVGTGIRDTAMHAN